MVDIEDAKAWIKRQDTTHLKRLYEEHKQTEEGHRFWRVLMEEELKTREAREK